MITALVAQTSANQRLRCREKGNCIGTHHVDNRNWSPQNCIQEGDLNLVSLEKREEKKWFSHHEKDLYQGTSRLGNMVRIKITQG